MATTGIYYITNRINNKVYIGSSVNIPKRWEKHKDQLNKGIHINQALQEDWDKYGEGNFKFDVVRQCDEKDLKYVELKEINENWWDDLYNAPSLKDEIIYLIANHLIKKNKEFEIDYKSPDCTNKKPLNFNIYAKGVDNEKELYFSLRNLDYVKSEKDEEKYLKSSEIKTAYVVERNGDLVEIEYFN